MAVGEKNTEELKSLVVTTLETSGVLGQIRAELRAHVYKAIDGEEHASSAAGVAKLTRSPEGRLMAEIVADFFEFYEFRHSLSVFLLESALGKERRSRNDVAYDAGLTRFMSGRSILEQVLEAATAADGRKGAGWHSSASSTTASPSPPPQSAAQTRPSTTDTTRHRESEMPPVGPPPHGAVGGFVGPDDRHHLETREAGQPEDAHQEAMPERRQPLSKGKLPSITGSKSPTAQDSLPLLRASPSGGASMGSIGPPSPDGTSFAEDSIGINQSFDEVQEDMKRLKQIVNLDRQIARLGARGGKKPHAGEAPELVEAPLHNAEDNGSSASPPSAERSLAGSPAGSAASGISAGSVGSNLQQAAASPLRSVSPGASADDGLSVQEDNPQDEEFVEESIEDQVEEDAEFSSGSSIEGPPSEDQSS